MAAKGVMGQAARRREHSRARHAYDHQWQKGNLLATRKRKGLGVGGLEHYQRYLSCALMTQKG